MVQQLMDNVEHTMKHALEVEEKIPLEQVTDFEEVCAAQSLFIHSLDTDNRLCVTLLCNLLQLYSLHWHSII